MHLADQVLEEQLRELDFEKKYFEELESFIEQEDIPVEEVEDFSSMADWYSARSLFQADNEDSILDELTLKLNQDEIHRAIEYELAKLPFFKRTIMDLYLINQMAVEEIAELKGITVTEAEAVIREVSGTLVRKLSSMLAA
jgi:DNA-directed RNA polymerase specialized sigma24 family protein